MTSEPAPKRPTRRTVIRGAAWSVPLISLAVASPAYAASMASGPVDETPGPTPTQE